MKALNLTQKLFKSCLIDGSLNPGDEISLKIDQILQQDATGTLVMLELEALGIKSVEPELAVQYVDHNLLQTDNKNADDHIFLQSAARKFGYWFSPAGNGISHAVHMASFGKPGKSIIGSDSHTCAAGGIAMLAMGSGGIDVAMIAAGEPYHLKMPKVLNVNLTGKLPEWVSAKDVVLEMLRRHDVKGGVGYVIEYTGDGVKTLTAWDRHVIANMGIEMGATASVFPSDEQTKAFLKFQKREDDWIELSADENATYDEHEEINLSTLEPLIACPGSPGNVVKVSEVAGEKISQVVVGSSANPGLRDFQIVAEVLRGRRVNPSVSLAVNPTSRQVLTELINLGCLGPIIQSGGRIHQTGCMGCIGMGQAPAYGQISLRTMPRNFPGRSGTLDDRVYLCSPETAVASALCGEITDPRKLNELGVAYPDLKSPAQSAVDSLIFLAPEDGHESELSKGPNIKSIPDFNPLPDEFDLPVLLKIGDNISTDEILKAGAEVLPLRSNIPEISKYAFEVIDKSFHSRAESAKDTFGGHLVVAGENYAQGSSREHAALAPRFLGQVAVLAKSYARIGLKNLINFGILPLSFKNPEQHAEIEQGDHISVSNLIEGLRNRNIRLQNKTRNKAIGLTHDLTDREIEIILAGGIINYYRENVESSASG